MTQATSKRIKMISKNGSVLVFNSTASASRCLSGKGDESLRTKIARRCASGGGELGNVRVSYTR